MTMKIFARIIPVFTMVLLSSAPLYAASDKGRADYWLKSYKEIKEGELSQRTAGVFKRVLSAADKRKGVEPRVHVIDYDGLPWAQSLEDGSIIVTKRAVEFCVKGMGREAGDARLAFVLGHELAHQLNADFWPYRFESSTKNNPEFSRVREFSRSSAAIRGMELEADQYGIIYAALAGFRTDAIVSEGANFFEEWFKATERQIPALKQEHDSLNQRVFAVSARLKEVSSRIEFFHAGVIAYHIGWHKEAIALFNEFLKYYPGREVYHNIGTAYLKLALKEHREARGMESMPFYLSIEDDPSTRADDIEVARGEGGRSSREFRENLEKAIDYLKKASESDPYYVISKINLGAAYILDERYYNALSELEDAAKLAATDMKVVNNTAIAHFLIGEGLKDDVFRRKAYRDFEKAAKGECGGIFNRNLSIAARMLVKSEDDISAVAQEDTEGARIPVNAIEERVGGIFKDKGFRSIGMVSVSRDLKLGLYENIKNGEVVFVRNGVVRMAYKKAPDRKAYPERRRCYGEVLVSKGTGIDLTRDTIFVYHK